MPFTVRVVGEDGRGIAGRRIVLSFAEASRGQSAPQFTDSDGRARFANFQPGAVRVYVDGADRGTFHYADGATVHVND